jgi:hypothetical protein
MHPAGRSVVIPSPWEPALEKLRRTIRRFFGGRRSEDPSVDTRQGFELYRYRKADGSFDYERYKMAQTRGNRRKIRNVWVMEENIAFLSDYIAKTLPRVQFGLCHGTRRGKEQEWFRKYLGCEVVGTEISDTAGEFPHTVQWDFHEVKPEWKGAVDFIYSNSLDHSYDPESCLRAWMSCVREGGICIIEHTSQHEHASELDPFGVDVRILPYLILSWGKGDFYVREVLDAPGRPDSLSYSNYLIIRNA